MGKNNIYSCFDAFDKNRDGLLSVEEFEILCRGLFRNDKGTVHKMPMSRVKHIFAVFDRNNDGFLDIKEFMFCWQSWIKRTIQPRSALLIIDVQNDFIDGTMSLKNCPSEQDGFEIIGPINELLEGTEFDYVIYSLDWHPVNHISFFCNLDLRPMHYSSPNKPPDVSTYDKVIFDLNGPVEQVLWPRHCVQESWGSALHDDLKVLDGALKVYLGTEPDSDPYSIFRGTSDIERSTLNQSLRSRHITDLYLCGLPYDVCVRHTAIDALRLGFRTIIIDDCCRGINLQDIDKTKVELTSRHGVIANSCDVKPMVEGRDRRSELGYSHAMSIKSKLDTSRLAINV